MVEEKMEKAKDSIRRAEISYGSGNRRLACGDLHHARENLEEAIYIIMAELELMESVEGGE